MTCEQSDIKELLPLYLQKRLDRETGERVESHLAACEDCGFDLSLLALMTGEPVPDPGEAFWAAMPGQIYRDVQRTANKKTWHGLPRFSDNLILPRWTWTAAAATAALIIVWMFIQPVHHTFSGNGLDGEIDAYDDVLSPTAMNLAELSQTELDRAAFWANHELSAIFSEAGDLVANTMGTDIADELAELDAHELERLSRMIEKLKQEDHV